MINISVSDKRLVGCNMRIVREYCYKRCILRHESTYEFAIYIWPFILDEIYKFKKIVIMTYNQHTSITYHALV